MSNSRRYFIGGSDARIITGDDEGALLRLWREKRGEVDPEDLSSNLIVQLGLATEDLNRRWYEAIQDRVESAHAGGRQGGHQSWSSRQALKVRCHQL
jgi:predicted phage-related endonuclease